MYTIKDMYDLDHTLAKDYLSQFSYPWEALKGIKDFILELGPTLGDEYEEVSKNVWVHKTATVFPSGSVISSSLVATTVTPIFSKACAKSLAKEVGT